MVEYCVLFLLGALTSAISAILGMAGGIILMTGLALYLPVRLAIPIHAIAQMTSNFGRVVIHFQKIRWDKVWPFFVAAIPGAWIGGQFATAIPESTVLIGAGIYVVSAVAWMELKKKKTIHPSPARMGIVGFASSFLGMIAGAVGPVMTPTFLAFQFERQVFIGTMAAAQSFNHSLKIPVYLAWGGFEPWLVWPKILTLLVGVFCGIPIGTALLEKLPEKQFRRVITWVTGIMGIFLFLKGLRSL